MTKCKVAGSVKRRKILLGGAAFLLATGCSARGGDRVKTVRSKIESSLHASLRSAGFQPGAHVYLRIFKRPATLEVWLRDRDAYRLFESHPISAFSGGLGPKFREGDRQAPEGFYSVPPTSMNPQSRYHLSFNLGFPNAFDRSHNRTGSFLMVHGGSQSIGCYAMTDPVIERIYLVMEDAFAAGQPTIPVHSFPFPMDEQALKSASNEEHIDFWNQLAPAWRLFEHEKIPPRTTVKNKRYVVEYGR